MKSIIIIIPYFGKLPPIFKFWRQSAINNPTIDFLFFTDCNIQSTDNIKVINVPLKYYEKSSNLDLTFLFLSRLPINCVISK
jgi:hypothetical protein